MIGNFKNAGRVWCKAAEPVLTHDWPTDSIGRAIPYGIYDTSTNHGYVCIGDCFDTPRFAVEAITRWWRDEGYRSYPKARRLLILADGGGSKCNPIEHLWAVQPHQPELGRRTAAHLRDRRELYRRDHDHDWPAGQGCTQARQQ